MRTGQRELERSRRAGFRTLWPRAADYEIKDGVLRPKKGVAKRWYAPMGRSDVINALMRLDGGSDEDIVRFAQRFGLLGHWWILRPHQHEGGDQVACLVPPDQRKGGDSVEWVRAQAATVALCRDLLMALQERDETMIKETLTGKVDEAWMRARELSDLPWERSWSDRARRLVREIVNSGLRRIHPRLFVAKDRSSIGFTFTALVDVVYWKLGLQLVRGTRGGIVRRCATVGCDGIFFQTDGRQRFCPSPIPDAESPCAIRQRLRDRRGSAKHHRLAKRR